MRHRQFSSLFTMVGHRLLAGRSAMRPDAEIGGRSRWLGNQSPRLNYFHSASLSTTFTDNP